MSEQTQPYDLDRDQELILVIYYLYTGSYSYKTIDSYLKYPAALSIIYYLTQKGFFNCNLNEFIQYDYMGSKKYIWEAKKIMNDINIIRDYGYLIRARSRSKTYSDVNAHQCTIEGAVYFQRRLTESISFEKRIDSVKHSLSCSKGHLLGLEFNNDCPYLICHERHNKYRNFISDSYDHYKNTYILAISINGFLKSEIEVGKYSQQISQSAKPFFI